MDNWEEFEEYYFEDYYDEDEEADDGNDDEQQYYEVEPDEDGCVWLLVKNFDGKLELNRFVYYDVMEESTEFWKSSTFTCEKILYNIRSSAEKFKKGEISLEEFLKVI